jgi:hypothetical protein
MTTSQMKRIRTKLDRARALTAEAHELAEAGHAEHGLRSITARAADQMDRTQSDLAAWDERNRQLAESLARQLLPNG